MHDVLQQGTEEIFGCKVQDVTEDVENLRN
jgi:hypothetical protein